MALPTTNLTLHCDASVNTDVWQFYQAGTPYHNTNAGDSTNVETWDDVEHGSKMWVYPTTGTEGPQYKVTTPLMVAPCLAFDGITECLKLFNDAGTIAQGFSTLVGTGAKTLIFSLRVAGVVTNAAAAYDNEAVFAEDQGVFGVFLRDSGGGSYKIIAYNWDGNEDKVEATIALNTTYVVTVRHDGTNLYLSLNGGTESSVASGSTTTASGLVFLGRNYTATKFFKGRIGEIAIYNAALTGSALTDAKAYFTGRWIAAAGTSVTVPVANITVAALAPTVAWTARQIVTVPVPAVTVAALAPTVVRTARQTVTAPVAAITVAAPIPTASRTANKTVTVPIGAVTVAGQTPVIARTARQSVVVPVSNIAVAGQAPAIQQGAGQRVTAPRADIAVATQAPVVNRTQSVVVPTANIAVAGHEPSADQGRTIVLPAAAVTVSAHAPSIVQTTAQAIAVPAATIAVDSPVPTVINSGIAQFLYGDPERVAPRRPVIPIQVLTARGGSGQGRQSVMGRLSLEIRAVLRTRSTQTNVSECALSIPAFLTTKQQQIVKAHGWMTLSSRGKSGASQTNKGMLETQGEIVRLEIPEIPSYEP